DEERLRKGCAVARDQCRRANAAEHRRSAVISFACLLIEGLHAAPQRGGGNQADQQCGELHPVPAPVAQEHGEDPQRALHATSPLCSVTCRSSVAASRALWVTIRKAQPVRVTRSRASASTSSAVASS